MSADDTESHLSDKSGNFLKGECSSSSHLMHYILECGSTQIKAIYMNRLGSLKRKKNSQANNLKFN